jgi:sugar (pentulose or hexulose) kinase
MKKHLAVDLGSSTGKITLGEIRADRTLSWEELDSFPMPRVFVNRHIRVDFYSVYRTIGETLRNLGRQGIFIDSLGADSWLKDFGIVMPRGDLAGLPVFYRDHRTDGIIKKIEEKIPYHDLYLMTTQRKVSSSTLGQLMVLLGEDAEILNNNNKILFPADLVMFLFSGRICSELSIASGSHLFNVTKKAWEDKVFDLFSIPKTIQPEIVRGPECLGQISASAAAFYGTSRFEIVAPAAHDTASAVSVIPVQPGEKDWAFIATGSWFLAGLQLDEPADGELSYRYNLSNLCMPFGKILLQRNIMGMWLIQECCRKWTEMGLNWDYQTLDEKTAAAARFTAFIDTEDPSFENPDDMPQAIVDFLARTRQPAPEKTDIGGIARIIYESISMKCAYGIRALEKISGKPVQTVYLIGGAVGIDFLAEMIASAVETKVITGPKQASSAGNVLLQACGCSELDSLEEIREIARNSFDRKEYMPKNPGEWRKWYRFVCDLCHLAE